MEILCSPCLLVRFLPLTHAAGAMPDFGRCCGAPQRRPRWLRIDAAMMHGIVGAPATASCLRALRRLEARALVLALVAGAALVSCSNPFDSKVEGSNPSTTTTLPNTPISDDAGTSQPTGKTYSVPRTIASDCSSDVTSPLSKWIASVPDNSTLMLGKGACYRIEGSLTIANRRSLLFDGNGATLKATTRGTRIRVHVAIDNSENIIVRNLTVKGANPRAGAQSSAYNPQFEAQHGFNLGGVRHVLLDNVQASDVYGDFVYISSSGQGKSRGQPSEHVAVVRSRFSRSGRQGIAITNARDVTIRGNEITDVARSMFDLEPNTERNAVRDIRIEQNTTGAGRQLLDRFERSGQPDRRHRRPRQHHASCHRWSGLRLRRPRSRPRPIHPRWEPPPGHRRRDRRGGERRAVLRPHRQDRDPQQPDRPSSRTRYADRGTAELQSCRRRRQPGPERETPRHGRPNEH